MDRNETRTINITRRRTLLIGFESRRVSTGASFFFDIVKLLKKEILLYTFFKKEKIKAGREESKRVST